MTLHKLFLLLIFMVLVGCNQSDTNQDSENEGAPQTQAQTDTSTDTDSATEPQKEGKIVARVNGSPIYEEDLNGRNLNFVITEEIIYQAGLEQGVDEDIKRMVDDYERMLIIKKTKQSMIENMEPSKPISDEEIQEYYERNKSSYVQAKIQEITVPDVNLGLEVKEKAEAGEDLQEIANSYPDVAITVTDIGYNRALAQKFEKKEAGSVSEVMQKPNGTFSVLKIVEIKDIPLKASKNSIRHGLESQKLGKMFDIQARRLAEKNNIKIERLDQ